MSAITLEPVQENEEIVNTIQTFIEWALNQVLLQPILDVLQEYKPKTKQNSTDYLQDAINKGLITYDAIEGRFTGSFSASITSSLRKLGAEFDGDGFVIKQYQLPSVLQTIITQARQRNEFISQKIIEAFSSSQMQKILSNISFANVYTQFLEDIDKQMMQNAGDVIVIQPVYNTKIKKQIAEAYSNNLKLYIKDFTDDKIVALRQYLQPLILENGYRSEVLQEYLTKSFNVNKAKAKFLARQESSLLMTSYTEARYQSEGIREFVWSSSGDSRVRPEHKLLNGKKFSFNNLPVIDSKTGERGLPGQAFGCRCRMKPVVNI
jgi:SPP1 gp7 family putative phage head morphogenesis protein